MRGRNRPKNPNTLTRTFESNGPDVKIRGTAQHVADKYSQLARDAQASGDPVAAENYLQHAEHYYRLIAAAQEQLRQQYGASYQRPFDEDGDEGEDEGGYGMPGPQGQSAGQDEYAPQAAGQGAYDRQGGQGGYDRQNGQQAYDRQGGNGGQGQGGYGNQSRYDRNNRQGRYDNRQDRQDRYTNDRDDRQDSRYDNRNEGRQDARQDTRQDNRGGDGRTDGRGGYDRQNNDRNYGDRQAGNDRNERRNDRYNVRDGGNTPREFRENGRYERDGERAPRSDRSAEQPVREEVQSELPAFLTAPVRPASQMMQQEAESAPDNPDGAAVEDSGAQPTGIRPRRRRTRKVAEAAEGFEAQTGSDAAE